jgi:hypothetical protein
MKTVKAAKVAEKASSPTGKKRSETRDRLIQCAIHILVSQGNDTTWKVNHEESSRYGL